MTIAQLKNIILEAFVNVKLGDGVSLRQSKVQSNYGEGSTDKEYRVLLQSEIRNNWREISFEELEKYGEVSFFDAESFRYYIPAYMFATLDRHESDSIWLADLLFHLYPKHQEQNSWDYRMMQYSLLDPKQNVAVATFLFELPHLFTLDIMRRKETERALRNYWGQFLPTPKAN